MSTKTPIFFLGATGYVGGAILTKLLAHPSADTFEITALVRSEEKAKKLESFGVKAVVGSYKDTALVEKLSEAAHVVFSCANSDDLPAIQAVVKGLRQRHQTLGDVPILIHTSGTGVLTYGHFTQGMAVSDVIYDDSDFEQVANINPAAWHRHVDNAIFEADKEGFCRTYIVVPGTVYGLAKGPLVDAGISNSRSFPVTMIVRAALARGQAGMVGKGLARWANAHIDDTVGLFIILYDTIMKDGADNVDHGIRGYYYVENGELSWYELAKAIGRAMVELRLSESDEPTSFTTEELVKYAGSEEIGSVLGSNSRARATHSRSLGWQPKYTIADYLASFKPEVEIVLAEQKKQ